MKRKIMGLVTAVLLVLGGSITVASPATAATADCPVGYSCQWRDKGFKSGTVEAGHFSFFQCEPTFSVRTYAGVGGYGSYSVSSISNKGRYEPALYFNQQWYQGNGFTLELGTGDSNLGDALGLAPGGYNDLLMSGMFGNAPVGCT